MTRTLPMTLVCRCWGLCWLLLWANGCSFFTRSNADMPAPPVPLAPAELKDHMLGALLGSAIGDAMGAPTEMWSRARIQAEYGHITGLTPLVRPPSPEGTWGYNLPAGGSTDDTRWKALMVDLITGEGRAIQPRPDVLSARHWAEVVMQRHLRDRLAVRGEPDAPVDSLEAQLREALWLKEWARVAEAYLSDDLDRYRTALSQFYGGEMACGGMLFAPMVGATYPGAPAWAYAQAYHLDIYDIGYARDLAGLTAALVARAMQPGSNGDSLRAVLREVDPQGYFRSRLVGRRAYEVFRQALAIAQQARQAPPDAQRRQLAGRVARGGPPGLLSQPPGGAPRK